ncbi:hypothetical protein [Aquincola tertiaricarbonis]|uniref:hypothetical protein n=1 Tax=Aquincola tertiaricarbonis TaxID=391953 RepID=UPI000614FACB|nr:hypothetical protein [Aquincola tertiaricarbonis]
MFFRAVKTLAASDCELPIAARHTTRLPANVPYVVDNLWEYLRPTGMPCRRRAIYASPSAASALSSAATEDQRHLFSAYEVRIEGEHFATQIPQRDAREHPDIRRVLRLLQERQPAWESLSWEARQRASLLFSPACARDDVQKLVEEDEVARSFIQEATALSTFWADAAPPGHYPHGEVFFELLGAAKYRLYPRSLP